MNNILYIHLATILPNVLKVRLNNETTRALKKRPGVEKVLPVHTDYIFTQFIVTTEQMERGVNYVNTQGSIMVLVLLLFVSIQNITQ